jgi:hypothetical protein
MVQELCSQKDAGQQEEGVMTRFKWTGNDEDGWSCETEDGYILAIDANKGRRYGCGVLGWMGFERRFECSVDMAKIDCQNAVDAHRWRASSGDA